jgi:hypothetical protein
MAREAAKDMRKPEVKKVEVESESKKRKIEEIY